MNRLLIFILTALLLSVAAQAATPINVAGKDISCDKDVTYTASDVTDIKSGTVSYTYSTNTLTLTNVTITRTGGSNYAIHNRSKKGLIVKFVGTCNLTTEGRVIRDQSGYENELVAASGATVTLKSTGDGAIYVRDDTKLWIKGPGTFNITGNKNGAIAGHGSWNATGTDERTYDRVYFKDVTAIITGAQSSLLGLWEVVFYAGSNVTLKATNNSSYPVVRQVYDLRLYGGCAITTPPDAKYNSSSESIELNGYKIYNQDIYITSNYALLLNSANFPDANFRNYMLSLYPKGCLTSTELYNLTSLNVANKGISNMKGVERLTNLKELRCYSNSFTTLNVSDNTKLTYLDCAPNPQLTSLYFNGDILETLYCYNTGITSLYTYGLPQLKSLSCYNTKLTSLSLIDMPKLTSADISNCTSLKTLYCYNNPKLTTLNASGLTSLKDVNFWGNTALASLNVSGNTSLETLTCRNTTGLTTLDCRGLKSLSKLSCYDNQALTSLNVSGLTSLDVLKCYNNPRQTTITGLADCSSLDYLDCSGCSLTDLSACNSMPYLSKLICYDNLLTSLTLTNSRLKEVNAKDNRWMTTATFTSNGMLETLDLSNCTALNTLYCYNNPKLTTLNVAANTALKTLNCNTNKNLSYINGLNTCTGINTLNCSDCALTDLSGCSWMDYLETINCSNNKLTSLTLVSKSKLTTVKAECNPLMTQASIMDNPVLKTLHIYACTALTTLYCYNNPAMTELDAADCTWLQTVWCHKSKLSSFNVNRCPALNTVYCHLNQITAANMTTLVNSLPTRSSGYPGTLRVMYSTGEGNVFDASHLSAAKAKYWNPMKYNGSKWVDITSGTSGIRGDVNGDGEVSVADINALVNIILGGSTDSETRKRADVNEDGEVGIADVNVLVGLILEQ